MVVLLAVSGCSASGQGNGGSDLPGLEKDALALREDNGLFRMPESERAAEGDAFTTALYASVDPDGKLAGGISPTSVEQEAGGSSYSTLPAFWAAVALKLYDPQTKGKDHIGDVPMLQIPDKQPSVDGDVAALWFWADSVRKLREGASPEGSPSARERLAALNVGEIRDHPYLVWRLWDTYDALKIEPPEDLTKLLKSASVSALPTTPESLFDTQAVLEASAKFPNPDAVPKELTGHLSALLSGDAVDEDVTRVSLLRSMELLGRTDEARRYLADNVIPKRTDPNTGFVRPIVARNGTIEGTYLVSRLLDQSFPNVTNANTAGTLVAALGNPDVDSISKLKALVALRRSGDARWRDHQDILDKVRKSLPPVVTPDQLAGYLDVIDALVQVEDNPTFSILEKFDAPVSDGARSHQALLALSKSSYFSNASEIGNWFPELQSALRNLVAKPSEPQILYVSGLAAMAGSPLSGLDSADFASAVAELKELQGCVNYKKLYRVGTDPGAPCSLRMSVQLVAAPGAYNFGGSN